MADRQEGPPPAVALPSLRPARRAPDWRWMAGMAGVWLAYLALVWTNRERHEDILAPLGVIPLLATGLLFGRRTGLLAGAGIMVASFVIHMLHGAGDTPLYDVRENAFRWAVGLGLGYGAGALADALRRQRRMNHELGQAIAERDRAERSLAVNQRNWQVLLANAPDYIVVIDAQMRVQHTNRTPPGLRIEDVLGQPIGPFVPDARERQALIDALASAVAGGPPSILELRAIGPNGQLAHYRCRIVHTVDVGGAPAALMVNADITGTRQTEDELARSQAALRASEERFRLAGKATQDVIYDVDLPAGRITWGEAMQATFGHDPAHLATDLSSWSDHIHPDEHDAIEASFTSALQGTADQWHAAYRFRRADDGWADVLDRCRIVRDAAGQAIRAVGSMTDITSLKRAEAEREALLAAEAAHAAEEQRLRDMASFKTQFLSNAAHELATPLTPLKLQLATMRLGPLGKKGGESFDLLERNVARLGTLVNDLLDAARLQAGHLRLRPATVQAPDLLARVVASFKEQAREAGVTLGVRPGLAQVTLTCDETRVEQVLFNLVHNALKFTPRGGQVWLGEDVDGTHAVLSVQDTGIGLAPEQAARLFQPFTQVHDASKVKAGGTGLGLYIARGIVEQHGGRLDVVSPGPGHGATFRLRLPITMAGVPDAASPAASAPAPISGPWSPGARQEAP